jgi:hypothetical protein
MLLSIQFPLVDSRAFLPQKVELVDRPSWPSPSFQYPIDFVRSFGTIKKRPLRGIGGWVGEGALCEADRALRFQKIKYFKDAEAGIRVPLELAFRRFYFDGRAVGKFEVGLSVGDASEIDLNRKQTKDLIEHFLKLPVVIPPVSAKAAAGVSTQAVSTELGKAGPPLARLYAASTIKHSPPVKLEEWWVLAGAPLLFLASRPLEHIRIPYLGRTVPRSQSLECDLAYHEIPYPEKGRSIRMWVMGLTGQTNYRDVRALKICLLRLHAEFEAIRLIGRNISSGKISIAPYSSQSNTLQDYLNEATRRVSRLSSQAERLSEDNIVEIARESEDMMNPGERDELLAFLKNLGIRKNIFHKIEKELLNETQAREVNIFMPESSKYKNENSTIGVQGDNANVGNVTQVSQSGGQLYANWSQSGGNLGALAQDLAKLKTELGTQAKDAEHFEAAAAVAKAEDAAKKNDGPRAFDYLKKAGGWALDIATKIGTTVAVEALKKAIGM